MHPGEEYKYIIGGIIYLAIALLTGYIGRRKRASFGSWFALGLIFSWLALIVVIIFTPLSEEYLEEEERSRRG